MALPTLKTLEECAEYAKVVEPFLPQLYELPRALQNAATTPDASLLELYKETNPLVSGFSFSVLLGAFVLVLSELNRNYSQIDRLWSVLPTIYNAHFAAWAHLNGLPSRRVDIILLWSTFWSVSRVHSYPGVSTYERSSFLMARGLLPVI